jgi:dimethylhistidine N-methyltransferase
MNDLAVHFYDLNPPGNEMLREVLDGLLREPRMISPKFFYDHRGSELFEAITETPEYYPFRTELALLESHGKEMAELLGSDCLLVELGSGSSRKIRLLLDALRPAAYMPVDISRDFLLQAASELAADYPGIQVHATCADYSRGLELPWSPKELPRAAFFPGSSIGNFEPEQARQLLQHVARALGSGGHLLIGVDLQKDHAVLNRAYNDAAGYTAAFNLNLLTHLNRELGSDFNLHGFRHCAYYNSTAERVEMHLVSCAIQQVNVGGQRISFRRGDAIHTENSYKYTFDSFNQLATAAGFEAVRCWSDEREYFSVHCLRVV